MTMLYYVLGIITGLLIVLALKKNERTIERIIEGMPGTNPFAKRETEFIPPTDLEAEAIGRVIEENEKRGLDTPIDELHGEG